ncbi:LLM class flavin-dependent oxidoreductase [Frigidibacter albus]|uniref:LLM class flavin-dependent oxidoreductase n=1 Tax=Frigidibacter albus TaxID=1465486 RepID=A0A6L8VM43_9RHOB|nr:LLM class flavin-dependent oxidoreductase [Frigidibacter albus]MZQ90439.1 LLM class flavin-dependent oxidoreductase [Frigidibacter albus]NBE32441.1 LLM class flavin-dependent oxidoreductase [Frigidibacter albus]GGH59767.1 oxidoreductase [Frigidibacter albus]
MTNPIEFGLDTFGDVTANADGTPQSHAETLRNVVAEAVVADQTGADFIGIGEHHRADFAVSAPEIVMAAIAAKTTRLRIGTAVTVLSSDDPVRLFQRFATLDALSDGRAELILGRGSFTESFPLFGFAMRDYEVLFEEKLDLLTRLLRDEKVIWHGRTRAELKGQVVYPRPERPLKAWIGVGGSPESVLRAVSHGLPMMLAIIGGDPGRFKPYVDLYHQAWEQVGTPSLPIGVHSPGHVGPTDTEARERFWPGYKAMHDLIGGSRGWAPLQIRDFEREIEHGSLYVGSPETVAKKIAATVRKLGVQRFDLKYSAGPQQPGVLLDGIELYGTKVIPMVRDMLA